MIIISEESETSAIYVLVSEERHEISTADFSITEHNKPEENYGFDYCPFETNHFKDENNVFRVGTI